MPEALAPNVSCEEEIEEPPKGPWPSSPVDNPVDKKSYHVTIRSQELTTELPLAFLDLQWPLPLYPYTYIPTYMYIYIHTYLPPPKHTHTHTLCTAISWNMQAIIHINGKIKL